MATSLSVGAAVYTGTRHHREERALEWPRIVEAVAEMSAEDVRSVIDDHPVVSEFVHRAWQTASQTVEREKRELLARAAARALREPTERTLVNAAPFLQRVLSVIEPAELELLLTVARPRPGRGQMAGTLIEGSWTMEEIEAVLPGSAPLIAPMTAMLNREGLIRDGGGRVIGTLGNGPVWSATSFALTFLDYVTPDWARTVGAALNVIIIPGHLRVWNSGTQTACDVTILVTHGAQLDAVYNTPFDLAPAEERLLGFAAGSVTTPPEVEVEITVTADGTTTTSHRLVKRPALSEN